MSLKEILAAMRKLDDKALAKLVAEAAHGGARTLRQAVCRSPVAAWGRPMTAAFRLLYRLMGASPTSRPIRPPPPSPPRRGDPPTPANGRIRETPPERPHAVNTLRIIALSLVALASSLAACETATVECVPDPAVGTSCRCTQGPTPPACTDLGSCVMECQP